MTASRRPRESLTPADIATLDYVDFITLIEETNRCPGGLPSLRRQALAAAIDSSSEVLEIGANTGFTSLELVKMIGCRITGIDPNEAAIREAQRRQALLPAGLRDRLRFEVGDARKLRHERESIDVIVCGGANSFIQGREAAFGEYLRVLRPLGRVTVTNFFYLRPPPDSLLRRLHQTLGVEIPAWDQRQWLRAILDGTPWEVISLTAHPAVSRTDAVLDAYVSYMIDRPVLAGLRPDTREAVRDRWRATCALFNENASYLGFFELVLRRPLEDLPEQAPLFLGPGEYDRWFERDIVGTRK